MAALLKKRALAEYSATIQEDPPRQRPLKKLHLTKKAETHTKTQQVSDSLRNSDQRGRLGVLLQLERSMPRDTEERVLVHRVLTEHFQRESDTPVRAKIACLLPLLCPSRLDELSAFIGASSVEGSHVVKAALMDAVVIVGEHAMKTEDKPTHNRCLRILERSLSDTSHLVKRRVLTWLAKLVPAVTCKMTPGSISSRNSSTQTIEQIDCAVTLGQVVKTLTAHTRHQEPRVRTSSLEAALILHRRNVPLDISLYAEATRGLNDDFECVRMVSMKLVVSLAQLHGREQVESAPGSGEKISLYDHAFACICQMINDGCMNVRVLAAQLLGGMLDVSPGFLEQTLDKKLMSNLRRKASAHERQREAFQTGEWSSGQKWQDDAPREKVDEGAVSLINQGACGFFVHALEDEFLEVRLASLDALCQLAVKFATFASQSLDFVVDMFNDEIEEVRLKEVILLQTSLKAIDVLEKMGHAHVLRDDQLDTVLAVLKDFSMYTREALHRMLCCCRLRTATSLNSCIEALLENLRMYPQDRRSIYRCLMRLGERNPHITLALVPKLLNIHPYLDLPEPDVEDRRYMAILIVVFNAAAGCATMLPLLEEHTLRHYIYLRDSMPHLVPYLEVPLKNGQILAASKTSTSSSLEQSESFLRQVLQRVVNLPASCSHEVRHRWLRSAIEDLRQLAEVEPPLAPAAHCARIFITCQSTISQVVTNRSWLDLGQATQPMGPALKAQLDELFTQASILEHRFVGLTPPEVASVRQLWLRLRALHLVLVIRGCNMSALGLCEAFLLQVDRLQTYLEEHKLDPEPWTVSILHELDKLSDTRPGSVCRAVAPLLEQLATTTHITAPVGNATGGSMLMIPHYRSTDESLQRIRQASAVINEPTGEQDLPIKFQAGLVVAVTLDCELENVADVGAVRIRLRYPDKQEQLVLPRRSNFRPTDDGRQRLYTRVLLSHGVWSEALHVELGVVLAFASGDESSFIELCEPVRVFISPKPIKKTL
ncbi:integrator complex subunit 4-like [Tropilaelaps mercedesae]|uniref:Integrator complex subunit 4-like n=1 Tax=Tropilaelaps mercedesae TaxID=418985 RepID=A0A1V9X3A3_9ACAR|nr:integrator complex subunit 4-like [Tropilaelaps mercedesae]